jgi:hypothetical protein
MMKRLPAIGVIVVGVAVAALVFSNSLFSVGSSFEDLTDGFRDTVMTDEAIAAAQADVAAFGAVSEEFPSVVEGLAPLFQMDAASFQGMLGEQFPAVAAGSQALPQIVEQFTGVVGLIGSQQENFNDADQLPTADLPATTLPWIILLIGVAGVVVGFVMFARTRLGAWLAIALGVVVVASSLLLSLVGKANAADDMNEAFKPVYNAELVAGSKQAVQVIGAMGQELQTAVIPAVDQQLAASGQGGTAMDLLGGNFPSTAAALGSFDDAMGRFTGLTTAFDQQLGNYEDIKDTSLSPIAWAVLFSGVLTVLFGVWGVLAARDET